MRGGVRCLFWVEVTAATITGTLALAFAIVPDWIEWLFGWDLDQGDESVEWLIVWLAVIGLAFVTIMLIAMAMEER
jgi:hypothetical protein